VVGKAALGLGTVGAALNGLDEATVSVLAALGDCNAVGEWTAMQQLGAADGWLPFGDVLAAGSLLLPGRRLLTGPRPLIDAIVDEANLVAASGGRYYIVTCQIGI
jgi:hypothetical protein